MGVTTSTYSDMTLDSAIGAPMDDETRDLLLELSRRVTSIRPQHQFLVDWCNRADALYFSDRFTEGGADLWPDDPSAKTKGRSHVSVNTPHVYVDVPSAMQAVTPIENMLANDTTDDARDEAEKQERLYVSWKHDQEYDLKFHKGTTVKSLYGITAAKVTLSTEYDEGPIHPIVEVIEQPRNLWLGYKTDNYTSLEWAAYVVRYEPNALAEQFNVQVEAFQTADGKNMPIVTLPNQLSFQSSDTLVPRAWLNFGPARIEVWDYWYRKQVWENGRVSLVTCNAVLAGNQVIHSQEHPEYKGRIPYLPLFNTFIPGVPQGRSELHDMEHLIREKYEKITAGSQMIANGVAGDYWQLVGPDAPTRVPAGLKPKRNELVGPGPGNRIETITPYIAQFQLEQYLGRLDREMAVVSGLNDLMLSLAPSQALNSSKAVNSLVANYETRLSMRRRLLYQWRKAIWDLALSLWMEKSDTVKLITKGGRAVLEIIDPSLSPRDDMETAQRAINLLNAKLWSQRRAMDAVGVDDPETEQDLIREERTDATMFPADVQVMAQLMSALQSLGLQAPAAQGQASEQLGNGQEDLRKSLGEATPDNSTGMQSPDTMGMTPPIPGAAPQAGGEQPPFAQPPAAGPTPAVMQGLVQNGQAKGRIKTQVPLGRR